MDGTDGEFDPYDEDLLALLLVEDLPTLPAPRSGDREAEIFGLTWEAHRNRRVLPLLRAAVRAFRAIGLEAGVRLENGSVTLTVAREARTRVWSDRRERSLAIHPSAGKLVIGASVAGWETETFDLSNLDEVVIERKLRAFAVAIRKELPPSAAETREFYEEGAALPGIWCLKGAHADRIRLYPTYEHTEGGRRGAVLAGDGAGRWTVLEGRLPHDEWPLSGDLFLPQASLDSRNDE